MRTTVIAVIMITASPFMIERLATENPGRTGFRMHPRVANHGIEPVPDDAAIAGSNSETAP
ncbi:hypothetical protein, partial [Candidatus Amarolinea dominans]|uniref:hypothetical protein n=1 Tax=Candidatus Amarolinea dominans TaxID=3140696 RepID=UPI0031CC8BDD